MDNRKKLEKKKGEENMVDCQSITTFELHILKAYIKEFDKTNLSLLELHFTPFHMHLLNLVNK